VIVRLANIAAINDTAMFFLDLGFMAGHFIERVVAAEHIKHVNNNTHHW